MIKRYISLMIISLFFLTTAALANDDGEIPMAEIIQYMESVNSGDYANVINHIPPAVLKKIAERAGKDTESFKPELQQELNRVGKGLGLSKMKPTSKGIESGILSDKNPYVQVPADIELKNNYDGTSIKLNSGLLGVKIDEKWYFVRNDDTYMLQYWKNEIRSINNLNITAPKPDNNSTSINPYTR